MSTTILTAESFHETQWAGGTTTEFFIYPRTAVYNQLNFSFRLSAATVQAETSEFTSLPDVSRTLMVLDGTMTLTHEGQHTSQLNKFDTDVFEGGWKTTSTGQCTDFNLMTMGDAQGTLEGWAIDKSQIIDYPLKTSSSWFFMYVYVGKVSIYINNEKHTVNQGDVLVLETPSLISLQVKGRQDSEVVFCHIQA
ncbi:HutD/Ves family protein [Microscilla marina]|uniref:Conserved protein n=1 Tax=Microscilla marina ATCC 23134 TaxID=313606 RepID=A1ZVU1_MICM2|nr:HutD family protein [Microscilla marina]EAY25518.1 conserved protein [Microscilla marina ATCC 23134]